MSAVNSKIIYEFHNEVKPQQGNLDFMDKIE